MNCSRGFVLLIAALALLALVAWLPQPAHGDADATWQAAVARLDARVSDLSRRVASLTAWRKKAASVLNLIEKANGEPASVTLPAAPAGTEPPVEEEVDRFEGVHGFHVAAVMSAVRHLGNAPPAARAEARFSAHKKTGRDPAYLVQFAFLHGDRPVAGATRTIVLIDEKRWVLELVPSSHHTGEESLVSTEWTWPLTPAEVEEIVSAKRVEVRLGGYEFTLDPILRAAMSKAYARMATAVRKQFR